MSQAVAIHGFSFILTIAFGNTDETGIFENKCSELPWHMDVCIAVVAMIVYKFQRNKVCE